MADMTLREALDHVRTYETKIVKPFALLAEALAAAQDTIDHALPAAMKELDGVRRELQALRAELPAAQAAAKDARAKIAAAKTEIDVAERTAAGRAADLEQAHRQRMKTLEDAWTERQQQVERAGREQREALMVEIETLTTKRTELDAAIAALRAKF